MTQQSRFLGALLLVGAAATLAACASKMAPFDFVPPSADAAPDALAPQGPDAGPMLPDAAAPETGPDLTPPLPEAAVPDAVADLPTATPDAGTSADSAPPDGAAPDAGPPKPEASVDAPADRPKDTTGTADAPDTREGGAICYWQGPSGPVECHEAYSTPLGGFSGRAYCSDQNVCTLCSAPELLNCDGDDTNACEATVSDQNCGACGRACNVPFQQCRRAPIGVGYSCQAVGDGG